MTDSVRPDWAALRAIALTANSTADQIKSRLPVAFVLSHEDFDLKPEGDKLVSLCPFHNDTNPSLDVYGENLERFGCFACGAGGDVLDFIGRYYGLSYFPSQIKKAEELLAEMPEGWTPPPVQARARVWDDEAAIRYVQATQIEEPDALYDFVDQRDTSPPADWLRAEFRLGSDPTTGQVVIPYYDRDDSLRFYKRRTSQTKPLTAPGARLDTLYGVWRDRDPNAVVVLCEGESDTWAAQADLPEGYVALGLPAGVGAHPKQAGDLAGRQVIVAFDGDDPGRAGALRWATALRAEGCEVAIAPMPEGHDLADLPSPGRYLLNRRPLMPSPDAITVVDGVYMRPGNDGLDTPMSNWSLDPSVELIGPDGASAYDAIIRPSAEHVTISSFDLRSKQAIVDWSMRQGAAWYGGDRDAQQLLGLLQAQGPFLTPGRMETVAGLHDGHYIWPDGRIGPDNWKYVAPPNSVHLENRMDLQPLPFHGNQVHELRRLHDSAVTDPVLAWLAIAPLRPLLQAFPILGVTGSSGTGKTTLMETMLEQFSGTLITTNLTSTTPHALFSFVGATNAFPVWFDEYRPGARRTTLESLQQVVRDAYTGQASSKGGMGQSWSEVTTVPASAPLIITGEDVFSETSHTERMILVDLPLQGRDGSSLDTIRAWGPHGLAHGYLVWVHHMIHEGLLNLDVSPVGPPEWPTRQRYNYGVLDLGWRLLDQFVQAYDGEPLGPPNWAMVHADADESTRHNPIKDAMLWALGELEGEAFIRVDEETEWLHIRVESFVAYVNRKGTFTLPGGPQAIRRYLQAHYGAQPTRARFLGKQTRAIGFPAAQIGWPDG